MSFTAPYPPFTESVTSIFWVSTEFRYYAPRRLRRPGQPIVVNPAKMGLVITHWDFSRR